MIAASGVEDVRDVLDHYNQESDPVEAFLIRQQALIVRFEFFVLLNFLLFFRKQKNRNDRQQQPPVHQ